MPDVSVVDIGINLTHRAFGSHWREVVQRAIDVKCWLLFVFRFSLSRDALMPTTHFKCIDHSGSNKHAFNKYINTIIEKEFRNGSTMAR
jgi:hypothetical protein